MLRSVGHALVSGIAYKRREMEMYEARGPHIRLKVLHALLAFACAHLNPFVSVFVCVCARAYDVPVSVCLSVCQDVCLSRCLPRFLLTVSSV